MSEFSSNPEAFDSREHGPLPDLIKAVQGKVMGAVAYEEKLQHLSVEEGHAGGRTTNIAIHEVSGNENVRGSHHVVVWAPEHGEEPQLGVARLEMRMSDESHTDFFLRVYDVSESHQNFLLNSKGLVPFNSANTDIEPIELLDPSADKANFTVKEDIECVPTVDVDVFTLDAIIHMPTYQIFELPRKSTDNGPEWGQAS
jgi:hypothetical protein